MHYVSDRFIAALTTVHKPYFKLDLEIANVRTTLTLLDGQVSFDSNNSAERTLSASVVYSDEVFDKLLNPLARLWAYRGVEFADGTVESVPLGLFVLDGDIECDELDGAIIFSASDLSVKLTDNKLVSPIVIASGTLLSTAINNVVTAVYPYLYTVLTAQSSVVDSQIVIEASESADPWADVKALAQAYGQDVFIDGVGVLRWRVASTSTAWKIGGDAKPSLLSKQKRASLAETYNGVVVNSTSADSEDVIQGVAWDDDHNSATYYQGAYGMRPKYITSSSVTTVDQAITLAQNELAKCKGRSEKLSWTQLVNPALEIGDIVEFADEGKRYVIDRLSIPLSIDGGGMQIDSREVRL